jgi:hypothetical protein
VDQSKRRKFGFTKDHYAKAGQVQGGRREHAPDHEFDV